MLPASTVYNDLAADHFHRSPELRAHRLIRQITRLGFSCLIVPAQKTEAVSIQMAFDLAQCRTCVLA
jgi:hypothetical protein